MNLTLAQVSADAGESAVVWNTLFLLARYLHIVCTTLLVGGTLFYEMVVPIAIADQKPEQQLAIFARARWVFRRIVWISAVILILSGSFSAMRNWDAYAHPEQQADRFQRAAAATQPAVAIRPAPTPEPSVALHPGWWWLSHSGAGMLSIVIALLLTIGRTPPANPVRWMRIQLVLLMVVIFLGSATRQVRLVATEPPSDSQQR